MQTAIVYSRILRQMAERQREQDKSRADQRLHGIAARSAMPTSAQRQVSAPR